MIEEISQDEFDELWNRSSPLACPLTRGHPDNGYMWLWNINGDPCKTKICEWSTCHNYGKEWDKYNKLLVPLNRNKTTGDKKNAIR